MRVGGWEAADDRGARSRRGLDCRLGAGHGEERTQNIWTMVVTLEVLAWLTFHPLMSWFIAEAPLNIWSKFVTCPTCHEPRGWLKLVA